ncbi:MAG: ABC transporter permease [Treponema sp.]|jgi:ribose/xylose/arabinose/galactoside ABC-type transport system permease subunit|nr:ABC transporter permease [Treponema sp.]
MQGSVRKQLKRALPAYCILLVLVAAASVLSEKFRTVNNFGNIFLQASPLTIAAIGQGIVLIGGGIDMSVGSIVSLSTVIMATLSTVIGTVPALTIALGAGLAAGVLNGIGSSKLRIPPLIITLSVSAIFRGISLLIMNRPGGRISPSLLFLTNTIGPISVSGIFAIVLYVLVFLVMHYSKTGRYLYAVGENRLHALQSGLPAGRLTVVSFMASGFFSALAGFLLAVRIYSGDPVIGDSYSMDSVAASVVGGILLSGGIGSIAGAFAGAMLLSMINNVLNMLKVFAYYQYIIKSLILIAALLVFQLRRGYNR